MLKKLLSTPTEQLGRASRFMVFQIKLWSHCAKILKKNRSGQQAASLAYHTVFGIVPLAIVILYIFQALGGGEDLGSKVQHMVYDNLHLSQIAIPDPQDPEGKVMLTKYIDDIVGKYFTGLGKGSVTIVSIMVVIWAALSLLGTIERAFNGIWHVQRPRSFLHRMINYWALLTLGPLLIGVGIYVATKYSPFGDIQKTLFSHVAPAVISYLISMVAFFLLYFVLPNTKVRTSAAIWGAAVAALVWTLVKWLFGIYVTKFIPYAQVYGVMGLIPLSVFWIYIMWLIVLFGLQVTFTTQHLEKLDAAKIKDTERGEEYFIANDFTAINIVRQIAEAFTKNKAPLEAEAICSELNLPADFGSKVLEHLVAKGILIKCAEPRIGYIPSQDPANITLSDISQAVATAGFGQNFRDSAKLTELALKHQAMLQSYSLEQISTAEQTPAGIENELNPEAEHGQGTEN